jgi:hypothetical protein
VDSFVSVGVILVLFSIQLPPEMNVAIIKNRGSGRSKFFPYYIVPKLVYINHGHVCNMCCSISCWKLVNKELLLIYLPEFTVYWGGGRVIYLVHTSAMCNGIRILITVCLFILSANIIHGGTVWCSWLRYCATSGKVAGSMPYDIAGIFH